MSHPGLRWVGAALILLFGTWVGLRTYVSRHAHATSGVTVSAGEASPAVALDAQPPIAHTEIPAQLPSFALSNLKGKSTPIATWAGKSLIINFWATWCAPCRREIPLLKALGTEWANREVTVVGIAVDYPEKVQQFADQFKINYPLLIGEQDALDVASKFGMDSPAFPFSVFTDRRGEVVALFVGELHQPQAQFILSVVQNLNEGGVQLLQARRTIEQGLGAMAEKHTE
jgi:thiol-disulfide isomerase/thioredoxin